MTGQLDRHGLARASPGNKSGASALTPLRLVLRAATCGAHARVDAGFS